MWPPYSHGHPAAIENEELRRWKLEHLLDLDRLTTQARALESEELTVTHAGKRRKRKRGNKKARTDSQRDAGVQDQSLTATSPSGGKCGGFLLPR